MAQRNGFKNKQRPTPYSTAGRKDRRHPPYRSQEEGITDGADHAPTAYPPEIPPELTGEGGEVINEDQFTFRREKKFANRARVYVGNLPRAMTEEELMALFKPYGEIEQVYLEKEKNFGFARMAYRDQAVRAISALNGRDVKGRELRVRFAASSCSVKVSNLHPMVSNELLHNAFSQFGEVEYAVVVTDERGRSLGYGLVDFAKKSQAMTAIERCDQSCFFLTKSPLPVTVMELVRENEEDGLPDKEIFKSPEYSYEREIPPRMAYPNTPEFDFGMRYKDLLRNERRARDELEKQLKDVRNQLDAEMEQFKHHEHANVLRIQLAEHQKEQARLQQRLHRHEQFLRGPPPPPTHMIPAAGHHMSPGPPPPHMGQPLIAPPPPQPLLPLDTRGAVINPLMAAPPRGGGQQPLPVPAVMSVAAQPTTFLLPSPGQQLPPPS